MARATTAQSVILNAPTTDQAYVDDADETDHRRAEPGGNRPKEPGDVGRGVRAGVQAGSAAGKVQVPSRISGRGRYSRTA